MQVKIYVAGDAHCSLNLFTQRKHKLLDKLRGHHYKYNDNEKIRFDG